MDLKSQSSASTDSLEQENVIDAAKQQVERLYHYTSHSTQTCLDYMPVVILCLLPGQPFGWIGACFLIKSMKQEPDIKEKYKRTSMSFAAVCIVMSVAMVVAIISIAIVGVFGE